VHQQAYPGRLNVRLRGEALRSLQELALRERRRPQDQAAILIEAALGLREGISSSVSGSFPIHDERPSGSNH
jgi:ABC-type enterobactin transport system permease subunit